MVTVFSFSEPESLALQKVVNMEKKSKSAEINAKLNHPVIDSDGHTVEFEPGFFDCMVRVAGQKVSDRFRKEWDRCNNAASLSSLHNWYNLSADERRDQRATRSPWWALPMKNTLDHATSSLPKLLYERLDETGLDYTVLYPSAGLFAPHIDDEELRKGMPRLQYFSCGNLP